MYPVYQHRTLATGHRIPPPKPLALKTEQRQRYITTPEGKTIVKTRYYVPPEETLRREAKKAPPIHKAILELEARKQEYRYKYSPEAAAVGFGTGFAQTLLSPFAIGETVITKGPREAGKEFVTGTVEWVKSVPKKIKGTPAETFSLGGELAGMWMIGKATAKAPKLIEPVRFAKKKKIPAEELIPEYVIERKRRFPMHRGSVRELFEKYKVESGKGVKSEVAQKLTTKPYLGFHTTPVAGGIRGLARGFKVSTEAKRSTDVPGMHIAARISPWFARFSEGYYRLGLPGENIIRSFLNIGKKRGSLAIGFEEARRLPPDVSKSVSKSRKFLIEEAERGTAYTTWKAERGLRRGAEIEEELVISPLTQVKPVERHGIISRLLGRDFEYYTEIWGKKLPIHRVEALREIGKVGKEVGKRKKKKVMTMEDYLSSFAKERGRVFELYPPSYPSFSGLKEYISRTISTSETTPEKSTGRRRYKEGYRKEYGRRSYISELEENLKRGRERSWVGRSYIGLGDEYIRIITLTRPPSPPPEEKTPYPPGSERRSPPSPPPSGPKTPSPPRGDGGRSPPPPTRKEKKSKKQKQKKKGIFTYLGAFGFEEVAPVATPLEMLGVKNDKSKNRKR
ncbi:MAG: hypothetical protein DRO11_05090 [Methanobacteriota archaeon]|nr:MAG: hypothetical protein DRO11_05090 [Euryarchaeota archaeon]